MSPFSILSYLLIFFIISLSDQKSIAPDNQKLYHDVVSGLGLYNNFKQIFELTTLNFNDTVFNSKVPKTWIVEFYNAWCGHCHRFAPIYKSFAVDIYNWREVVAVGAVDCASDENNQLCRNYEIAAYPSLKVFPIGSHHTSFGALFTKGTVDEMRIEIVKQVESEDAAGISRENLTLKPFNGTDLNVLWFNVPIYIEYIVVVIVDPQNAPHLFTEVALDFYPVKKIQVRAVHSSNKGLLLSLPATSFPTVYIIERDNTIHSVKLPGHSREDIFSGVNSFLEVRGIRAPQKERKDITRVDFDVVDAIRTIEFNDEIKKKLHSKDLSDVVFQVDLEKTIRYSLYHEIGNHKYIEGDLLVALKNYLTVLNKYFPIGVEGRKFFHILTNDVLLKDLVLGENFTKFAKDLESSLNSVFLPEQNYIGCRGSRPTYRGYPCGLWTLFHTLTVQSFNKQEFYPGSNVQEVLNAMVGYIKNFFGCTECAEHFQKMAVTMAGNVTTLEDSILWLWKAHNSANLRLAGDVTEDPEHKKIEFPSPQSCPSCRTDYNEWIDYEVLNFLKSMYTNISYIQWSDLPSETTISTEIPSRNVAYSKRQRHENTGEESGYKEDGSGKSLWGFNIFDISLCVTLYTASVLILILVFVKFVVRKSYKKKTFDIGHGKV